MGKQKGPTAPDDGGEEQVTTRMYRADSAKLRQLAALMDVSAPEAYRRVCGPVVDAALVAAARRRATEVEREAKDRKPGG